MKSEERFMKDFTESHFYVNLIANWFNAQGVDAKILPYKLRPSVDVRTEYSDDGDMEITMKVEVKHRTNVEFTSIEDYPYPTVMIDQVHRLDGRLDNLYAVVICSKSGDYAIIIPKFTSDRWVKVTRYNPASGGDRTCYEIDKKYCKCYKIK